MACLCPCFSNKRGPEATRLIEEFYHTVESGDAILEPAAVSSGEKSLTIKPKQPTFFHLWTASQARSVGDLLSRVLIKIQKDGDHFVVLGRANQREGFFYEVAIFSGVPRMTIDTLAYACLYGGKKQSQHTRSRLHHNFSLLPDMEANGLVSLPISDVSVSGGEKVHTYQRVDIFLKEHTHLILIFQDGGKIGFTPAQFSKLEQITQRIIQIVISHLAGFSWITYFDPRGEVLTKHLHFFKMPKSKKRLEKSLQSWIDKDGACLLKTAIQSIA